MIDNRDDKNSLDGSVVVVTGSSSGIGRAIALELARRGVDIVVHGRSDSERIQNVCTEIKAIGPSATPIFGDFSKAPGWSKLVDTAWAIHGKVDFWINNAGGDVLTGQWRERDFESKLNFLLQTDVTSSLMLSRFAGQRMKSESQSRSNPGSKCIVNIGWDQAWQGMAGDSGELFATTKGAIMSMTKSLAQSLAPEVRVNCIAPGWIKTKWGEGASEYWDNRAKNESLMGRWGTPEDVANAAAFLCSSSASFISGHTLPINGGFRYRQ